MTRTLLFLGLIISYFAEAQVISIPDNNFKAALLLASEENGIARDVNQNFIMIDTNGNGEIDLSEAAVVHHLLVGNFEINSMQGVENFPNLETLECSGNNITTLNVTGIPTLRDLGCTSNQLTNLDVSGLTNLEFLYCSDNNLTSLTMTGCTALHTISCPYNQLASLDVAALPNLSSLTCNDNILTALNLGGLAMLDFVDCSFNQVLTLNLEGCALLDVLLCAENQIQSVDLSDCHPHLMDCDYNQIEVLIIKNGYDDSESYYNFGNNPLQYLCVDESEAEIYQEILDFYQYDNAVLNSYCSFTPGGNYNTISGTIRFDADGNGCDTTDVPINFAKVHINDGTQTGTTFSTATGAYSFFTQEGNFTITPEIENEWFSISPASATVDYTSVDNSTSTFDFCITPSGSHPDAEVIVMPWDGAQPGFDATYKIAYRNKGNQILSGSITFTYNDLVLDYVAASVTETFSTPGTLTWNYSNLVPFEERSFYVTLNVNSPQEEPAVNIDDVLQYSVAITPVDGDETPNDNTLLYDEIVTGSFDPNDITCLEGEVVNPQMAGEYLHYNINFENTGTAAATFIVVKQVINEAEFDMNTLQLLNASHNVQVKLEGNIVEYRFDSIDLGPLEKGNLVFKIKSLGSLQEGDNVMQKAEIYFDYNWPIVTNEAITTFDILAEFQDFTVDNTITAYPNPAKDVVNITAGNTLSSIEVYDVQGRLLQRIMVNEQTSILNLSDKSDGIYFLKIATHEGSKIVKLLKV